MDSGTAKAMGSLGDLLLDYVGSARAHDTNYEIAQGILRNYAQLSSMSLRQMANACFVSPASLSRFCRFIGFSSFAEFKEAVDGANYRVTDDYSRAFYAELVSDKASALATYRAKVADVLGTALSEADLAVVDEIVDAIDGAGRIAFFSHHFLWHIGRYFQGKMLQLGRYVELFQSYDNQVESAETLGQGDVVLICSLNGSYFSHYQDLVGKILASGATVIVLTQNTHSLFINRADYVLICGASNENDIGKYAALMTVDYLVLSYIRHLREEEAEYDG